MEELEATRHPPSLLITYSAFYSAVFVLGLLGNVFVVLAVVLHPQLRSSTDYLISSLATADLLIILFCLPTTLLNNLLTAFFTFAQRMLVTEHASRNHYAKKFYKILEAPVNRVVYCMAVKNESSKIKRSRLASIQTHKPEFVPDDGVD
uniref:G_PROTEIN_RECEP_F1_2 domain-containing protein n=1 Tax=Ascaris lumbricoides TaxID=6252 RepID=A0A0M3I1B2_ASCLU